MSCLGPEEYGALLEGALPAHRRSHLDECAPCAEECARLEAGDRILRAHRPARAPRPWFRPWMAAAAALLAMGVMVWALTRRVDSVRTPNGGNPTASPWNGSGDPRSPETFPGPGPSPTAPNGMVDRTPPAPSPRLPEVGPGPAPSPTPRDPVVKGPRPKPSDPFVSRYPRPTPEPAPEPIGSAHELAQHLDAYELMLRRAGLDEAGRAGAIMNLGRRSSPEILARMIAALDGEASIRARAAAATGLAGYPLSRTAATALTDRLSAKGDQGALDVAILDSLAQFDRSVLRGSTKRIAATLDARDPAVALSAIRALAAVRHRDAIEPLLAVLGSCERDIRGYVDARNLETCDGRCDLDCPAVVDLMTATTGPVEDPVLKRYVMLVPDTLEALQSLTGRRESSRRAWAAWWSANSRSFQVPE